MPAAAVYSILNKKENAHDDPIYCCAWSTIITKDNGKVSQQDFLVTGGLDNLVKVWHFENNRLEELHILEGHCMAVVSVAVSSDGHTIASTSLDSTLIIWDLTSGLKVHYIKTGATDVWKVAFSPDGTKVVSGSHTGKVNVYCIVNNTLDKVLDTRGKFALCVAWSNNSKYIASGSVDGSVHIFNISQSKLIHTIEAHTQTVRSVEFSLNSKLLLTASNDGCVKLFDVESGNEKSVLDVNTWALSACFSPDATRVAVASGDGTVTIALVTGCKVLKAFKEHADTVWDVKFNSKGNKLLSVSKDKTLNIYECPTPPGNAKHN